MGDAIETGLLSGQRRQPHKKNWFVRSKKTAAGEGRWPADWGRKIYETVFFQMYIGGFGGRKKTGQTASSPKVICATMTKKYAQPFYNTNTTRRMNTTSN